MYARSAELVQVEANKLCIVYYDQLSVRGVIGTIARSMHWNLHAHCCVCVCVCVCVRACNVNNDNTGKHL